MGFFYRNKDKLSEAAIKSEVIEFCCMQFGARPVMIQLFDTAFNENYKQVFVIFRFDRE